MRRHAQLGKEIAVFRGSAGAAPLLILFVLGMGALLLQWGEVLWFALLVVAVVLFGVLVWTTRFEVYERGYYHRFAWWRNVVRWEDIAVARYRWVTYSGLFTVRDTWVGLKGRRKLESLGVMIPERAHRLVFAVLRSRGVSVEPE